MFKEKKKKKGKKGRHHFNSQVLLHHPMETLSLFLFLFFFSLSFFFLFPAAEVIKPESKNHSQLLVPSPILSPSLSTDEDSSVYSPNSHDLLDDLLDWNGQQHTL